MENTSVKTEGNTTAVVVAKPAQRDYRMGLFDTDKFLNGPGISRAFGVKPILDKDGKEVGFRTALNKKGDLAKEFSLTGKANKDALDAKVREVQEAMLKQFKAWFIMQPDSTIGISRYAFRKDKDGVGTHTVAIKELPDRVKADLQKLADAHGVPMDKLAEFLAQFRKPSVEVEATVTQAAPSAPVMKVVPSVVKK